MQIIKEEQRDAALADLRLEKLEDKGKQKLQVQNVQYVQYGAVGKKGSMNKVNDNIKRTFCVAKGDWECKAK